MNKDSIKDNALISSAFTNLSTLVAEGVEFAEILGDSVYFVQNNRLFFQKIA